MNASLRQSRGTQPAEIAADLRALLGQIKRRLREQADVGDLTPSQVAVLLRLEREGAATMSDLARAEGMRPQSMATIVGALQETGFVAGTPDPSDGRRILLALTDGCRNWIEEGRASRQDWLTRKLQTQFSSDELAVIAQATDLLQRLVKD